MSNPENLSTLLARREDPMSACWASSWLTEFLTVPDNAAIPLAMSARHPRATGSYGAECIAWAEQEFGIKMRWWQALAITRQLEHDINGDLVWREVIDSGPRRIGKSVRLRVVAMWRIVNAARIGETQHVMLVSKDLAVGKEIHSGAWRYAEAKWGRGSVIRINGGQEIVAPGDSRWLLRAEASVYGYDVGYGQVDESWGVKPDSIVDGLEPALLERLWSQLHLTSTAHVKATSLMRRRLHSALLNSDPDVLLILWGAHPDLDYQDVATWKQASPHWSDDRYNLIKRKYLKAKAGENDPEIDDPDPIRGWAAQYLNVWPRLFESDKSIFPNWSNLSTTLPAGQPAALGVASDLDQIWVSWGSANNSPRTHLGSVNRVRSEDTAFITSEIKRIQNEYNIPVVIDTKGPAGYLIKELTKVGVKVTPIGLDDLVQACSDLHKAIAASQVEHGGYTVLNDAVNSATWRKVGDRRVFGRMDGDISMLEAVTLAYWAISRVPVEAAPAPFFLR